VVDRKEKKTSVCQDIWQIMVPGIEITQNQHGNVEINISEQVKQVFFEHLQGKKTQDECQ
jgi:hypothetical protein